MRLDRPLQPRLLIAARGEDVRVEFPDFRRDSLPRATAREDGGWDFDVPADRRFNVGLFGGRQAWQPREVALPSGVGRFELVLPAIESDSGTLVLETLDSEGRKRGRDLVVRIEDPRRGVRLASLDRSENAAWPLEFELPVGDYRIAVEGLELVDSMHGSLVRSRNFGRWESLVQVQAGSRQSMRAVVPAGARLRLQLEGAVQAADCDATRRDFAPATTSSFEYWAERATISLRAPGRWPEPVLFKSRIEHSDNAGDYLQPLAPLGSTQTSEVLPAGRFLLEARLRGGRLASREIVLVDGETTDVTLHFE